MASEDQQGGPGGDEEGAPALMLAGGELVSQAAQLQAAETIRMQMEVRRAPGRGPHAACRARIGDPRCRLLTAG
jgi:hypothetical protein